MDEERTNVKNNNPERRRTLIVNPVLQKRLIRDVSLVPILALIAGVAVTAVSFRLLLLDAVDAGITLPGVYPFLGCLAGFVFLSAFVTLNMAARISNRVAGPLVRLHRAMERLGQGDFDCRIRFREGDYLEDTAEVFNRLVDRLAERAGAAPGENRTEAPAAAGPAEAAGKGTAAPAEAAAAGAGKEG